MVTKLYIQIGLCSGPHWKTREFLELHPGSGAVDGNGFDNSAFPIFLDILVVFG